MRTDSIIRRSSSVRCDKSGMGDATSTQRCDDDDDDAAVVVAGADDEDEAEEVEEPVGTGGRTEGVAGAPGAALGSCKAVPAREAINGRPPGAPSVYERRSIRRLVNSSVRWQANAAATAAAAAADTETSPPPSPSPPARLQSMASGRRHAPSLTCWAGHVN